MGIYDIILLAIALAMDCLTLSIVCGVLVRQYLWKTIIQTAFLFGLFQMLMPLLGWMGVGLFNQWIEPIGHWIAFGLLTIIGVKMIVEAFHEEEEPHLAPQKLLAQLMMAVATSIDALAVGISMRCTNFLEGQQLILPLTIIGAVSLLFTIMGYFTGIRFGNLVAKRIKPEILGGTILILLGIKVLLNS